VHALSSGYPAGMLVHDQERLDSLRSTWGRHYLITWDAGIWSAARRRGAKPFSSYSAADLEQLLGDDWRRQAARR
jgi:hypothetical protein